MAGSWGASLGIAADVADRIDRANESLLAWAAYYLSLGIKPLPVPIGRKHPVITWNPYERRYPTEDEIRSWFADRTVADSGLCGVLDGTEYVVADLDGPPDLVAALLEKFRITIPHATGTVSSGSGRSSHIWFRSRRPIGRHVALVTLDGRTAGEGGAQMDLLGAGLVMLPPSRHPQTGQPYIWRPPIFERERVPELPAGIVALLDHQPVQPHLELGTRHDAIPEGRRERDMCRILGATHRQGANERELRALAAAVNGRCEPPLAPRDLDRIARSIAKYPVEERVDFDRLFASVTKADGRDARGVRRFETPPQIVATYGMAVNYVLPPYLIAGAITDLIAKPKEGKTRFRNYLISCLIRGASCLGYAPVTTTPVVLLTEEPPSSLLEGLMDAGLLDTSDLHVLTLFAARDLDWPGMVAAAQTHAKAVGARALIVDTVPALARLEGDAENSAGHNLAALRPLQEAAGAGLAVATVRHDRKAGGVLVDRGRGSSAWAGGCDVLIGLQRPKGGKRTVRRLEAVGRFASIPSVLLIDRVEVGDGTHTYHVVANDERDAPPPAPDRERLADRLQTALPHTEADALTAEDLADALQAPATSVKSAIKTMRGIERVGTGRRGNPVRLWMPMKAESPGDPSSESVSSLSTASGSRKHISDDEDSDETTPDVSSTSSESTLARTPERAPPGIPETPDSSRRPAKSPER